MMTKVIVALLVGLTTASVVSVPLGIATAAALGLDKLSGMAIVALGVNAGFTAGILILSALVSRKALQNYRCSQANGCAGLLYRFYWLLQALTLRFT